MPDSSDSLAFRIAQGLIDIEDEDSADHDPTKFYPSEASISTTVDGIPTIIGACLRAQYYRFTATETKRGGSPDGGIGRWLGDVLHEALPELLFNAGYTILHVEAPIKDIETWVSGKIDVIIQDRTTNQVFGVEIKTVGDYATRMCYETPNVKHLLQALYYMHWWNTNMVAMPVKCWYLLYFARSENYLCVNKRHGSPLKLLWDYSITENEEGVHCVSSDGTVHTYPWIHSSLITERWETLKTYIINKVLPPRDYEPEFTEEMIVGLYQTNRLPYKKQRDAVKKWIAAGAPPGELPTDIVVDSECMFCPWKGLCLENLEAPNTQAILEAPEPPLTML